MILRSRQSLTGVALALAMTLASAMPAHSAVVGKLDPVGDARAGVDITKVVYHNGPRKVSARLTIPGLAGDGAGRLWIAPAGNQEFGYSARLRRTANNVLEFRLIRDNSVRRIRVRCRTGGTWSSRRSLVVIAVPHRCLDHLGQGPLYLFASVAKYADTAPPATVARG